MRNSAIKVLKETEDGFEDYSVVIKRTNSTLKIVVTSEEAANKIAAILDDNLAYVELASKTEIIL